MYIAVEALPITSRVKLIDKREFAKAAMDGNPETFVVYVAALEVPIAMLIHPSRAPQVQNNSTLAALQWDKALTKIPAEYSDYVDIFSTNLVMELLENTGMNEYTIELVEGKQPPYGPIYTLSPLELETLKTYI